MNIGRIIESASCVAEGADWVAAREPRFAEALELCGPLALRQRPEGFEALLTAIVGQPVSIASAAAIWKRLDEAGLTDADAVAAAAPESLRAAGLSRPKIAYAQGLARSGVDFVGLRTRPDEEVIATLTAIKGIGVWTAEIYAMFALGRADVFAAGDLALQEAARVLFELPERLSPSQLRTMALDWSLWGGAVAARLLWAYYRAIKQREGIR